MFESDDPSIGQGNLSAARIRRLDTDRHLTADSERPRRRCDLNLIGCGISISIRTTITDKEVDRGTILAVKHGCQRILAPGEAGFCDRRAPITGCPNDPFAHIDQPLLASPSPAAIGILVPIVVAFAANQSVAHILTGQSTSISCDSGHLKRQRLIQRGGAIEGRPHTQISRSRAVRNDNIILNASPAWLLPSDHSANPERRRRCLPFRTQLKEHGCDTFTIRHRWRQIQHHLPEGL